MQCKSKYSFSVGFNGKISDLKKIIEVDKYIDSVYSGGVRGIVAGGRPQYAESIEELSTCVALAHENNLKYEIALNAPCGLPPRMEKQWWIDLDTYLKTLEEIGVDRIIASHPFLISEVKKKTSMEAVASTICEITERRMAVYYESIGADIIIPSMNANFSMDKLKEMKAGLKHAKLRIMLNEACLGDCPWRRFHHSSYAHSDNEMDYHLQCRSRFIHNPSLLLSNNCIRPEDMKEYFSICDNFKIVGRLVEADLLCERIVAYQDQKYDGNYVFLSDIELSRHINIPNKKLDGLYSQKINCKCNCDECNYCNELYQSVSE